MSTSIVFRSFTLTFSQPQLAAVSQQKIRAHVTRCTTLYRHINLKRGSAKNTASSSQPPKNLSLKRILFLDVLIFLHPALDTLSVGLEADALTGKPFMWTFWIMKYYVKEQ